VIDLHLHTTASDGRSSPAALVDLAVRAGLSVISVVDHDTTAAVAEVSRLADAAGLRLVPGIEMTAVCGTTDVHVLGYHLDVRSATLQRFLDLQRRRRVERVHAMLARLEALGVAVAFEQVTEPVGGRTPHAIGRAQVARAMARAGYVADASEAFDRYLGEGQPAHVPREGAGPEEVVGLIVACGGIASLAHPALLGRDDLLGPLASAGMQAVEVYHPDHSAEDVARYRRLAREHGLAVTGGSDFHGEQGHGVATLGHIVLPPDDYARFDALPRSLRQGESSNEV
jgi:predicted metal-dependent phosphoesterase TrpH